MVIKVLVDQKLIYHQMNERKRQAIMATESATGYERGSITQSFNTTLQNFPQSFNALIQRWKENNVTLKRNLTQSQNKSSQRGNLLVNTNRKKNVFTK